MKLKQCFIISNTGDETVIVSTGENDFSGVIRLNETAGFIANCLQNDITKEEMIAKILKEYEITQDKAKSAVEKVLSALNQVGAIEE